jgi:putative RNA 2'-phosphotransferase
LPKRQRIKVEDLARFMIYILGHSPHEFGLVPDREGFVTYKELLWAIHEEPGWGYVRQGHINEVLLGQDRSLFQADDDRIRTLERRWPVPSPDPTRPVPKILFTPIRRRAHRVVMEKGLTSSGSKPVVLSSDKDMVLRIGKRRDQEPVPLVVMASHAQGEGVLFYPFGNLFLCPEIPARYIFGPPAPKEALDNPRAAKGEKEKTASPRVDFTPGTFQLDPNRDTDTYRRAKGRKKRGWKEKARKMRK